MQKPSIIIVGMCTGVIVHDLSCSIPDVLFIMLSYHTFTLLCNSQFFFVVPCFWIILELFSITPGT